MRTLVLIRIVHSPSDMGSMRKGLEKESISKVGAEKWKENQRRIETFWKEVENEIYSLNLDLENVRIYQDGLPCGGDLGEKIVKETANKGSQNYQIILKLVEKGAKLEATESPELLIKEFEHIKAFINAPSENEKRDAEIRYDQIKDELLKERDIFIAKSIDATLKDDQTGILFIGAAHDVVSFLEKDIKIKQLD